MLNIYLDMENTNFVMSLYQEEVKYIDGEACNKVHQIHMKPFWNYELQYLAWTHVEWNNNSVNFDLYNSLLWRVSQRHKHSSVMKTAKAFDHGNNSSSMSRYGHEEAKMSQAGQ